MVRSTVLDEMVGGCDFSPGRVDYDITERHFPFHGERVDVSAMRAVSQYDLGGERMTPAEIEAAIPVKYGPDWRPANLMEKLDYAQTRWNGSDPIVALGSSWEGPEGTPAGVRYFTCLMGRGGERGLRLIWTSPESRFRRGFLFLIVRKTKY